MALAVDMASRGGGSTTDDAAQPRPAEPGNRGRSRQRPPGRPRLPQVSDLRSCRQPWASPASATAAASAFDLTAASADIKAAVPYYGTAARAIANGLDRTKAAVLVMYGGTDTRITGERERVEAALKSRRRHLRGQGLRRRRPRLLQRHRWQLQQSRGQRRLDHDARLVPQVPGLIEPASPAIQKRLVLHSEPPFELHLIRVCRSAASASCVMAASARS